VRCEALVAGLAREAEDVLRPLLPTGTRCALVGFPNHDNAGDSAIWVGERMLIQRLGADVVYACDVRTYSPDALDASLGDGTILLHGGGNLGDLWPRQQRLRESVLEDFPGKRVVQLPQSIHFDEQANVDRFRDVVRSHGDLVVLARERQSFEVASSLGTEAILCPDLAFLLGPLERRESAATDILWLARTDKESRFGAEHPGSQGVLVVDWIQPVENEPRWSAEATAALENVHEITARFEEGGSAGPGADAALLCAYDTLAAQRVERGCRILARGRVVVADRLHGHILSLLMGLPNVVLDNSYGKTRAVYETWTARCELATWADSPDEALAAARRILPTVNR
jgi:pyruvyl transferase EpsO